ncbi:MAG: tRNA lysidine(34) synthetase [Mycoplasmoidaceae bacterium]
MRIVIGNIIRANSIFHMIKKGDHIAVGVSGGKDSLVLLKSLDILAKKLNKESNWNLKVKGFHVALGFKKVNYAKLTKFAKANNIDLEILDSNIAEVLNVKKEHNKIQCSLCAKMKKAILIKAMKAQKFNKLALGHHADDAIETFFMNMLNESRLATLKPVNYLDRNKVWLIRPLILCREKEIEKVAKKYKFPVINNLCPNEKITQRTEIKNFINKNFYDTKKWPNAYVNIFRSFLNKEGSYIWFDENFDQKLLKNHNKM